MAAARASYSALEEADVDLGFEVDHDHDDDDAPEVIIHRVHDNQRTAWTHVEDLDIFFTRMYKYYLKGGFLAMVISVVLELLEYAFVVFFVTFLAFCINYPLVFREGPYAKFRDHKNITFHDIIYPSCPSRITFAWWFVVTICLLLGTVKLIKTVLYLFQIHDIKLFYNKVLNIPDSELHWMSWSAVQSRVKEAQNEIQMCVHKRHITELDIYHRILRYENYMVAIVNKKLLPLHINLPIIGEIPYLSKGLQYNLEFLFFHSPWSPWENCWHVRGCYKDSAQRSNTAKQLQRHIQIVAALNFVMAPFIFVWHIIYIFFSYADHIKRSPETLGLRTWSVYSRISLRHFNELDHEFLERLNKAHKPATKYLSSFPSVVTAVIAKYVAFFCTSILGVVIIMSIYDEVVFSIDNMFQVLAFTTLILAVATRFIPQDGVMQRSTEELLVQVLSHIHYLPPSWKGRAHTKSVARHFQQLFPLRFVDILVELTSPFVCPFILYKIQKQSLDIVDFYRNFTVSVLDLGDVCSFAQMDVRRHGNPKWTAKKNEKLYGNIHPNNQTEGGKTELSLVAFSHRNPTWQTTDTTQRQYLQVLHNDVTNVTNNYHNAIPNTDESMLSSYYRHNQNINDSHRHQHVSNVNEDEGHELNNGNQQEMSASALFLYDTYNNNQAESESGSGAVNAEAHHNQERRARRTNEDTPLLISRS